VEERMHLASETQPARTIVPRPADGKPKTPDSQGDGEDIRHMISPSALVSSIGRRTSA